MTNRNKRESFYYCINIKNTSNVDKIETIFLNQCSCNCNCSLPFSETRRNQQQPKVTTTANYELEGLQCSCNCSCKDENDIEPNSNNILFRYFKFSGCLCQCIGRELILNISINENSSNSSKDGEFKYWVKYHKISDNDETDEDEDEDQTDEIIYLNKLKNKSIQIKDYRAELFLGVEKSTGKSSLFKYHLCIDELPLENFKNYQFYKNQIKSKPDGNYIDEIHLNWKNDLKKLEIHHGYVQWLFPLYANNGMNYHAHKLERIESKLFRNDIEIANRILLSYEMMLNFYGIKLVNRETGELARSDNKQHSDKQFNNLSNNSHNNLRISRIITFLGHVGFQRYKQPLVLFLKNQITQLKTLSISTYSLKNYWEPLINYTNLNSYFQLTLESESDLNEESIYFYFLNKNKNDNIQMYDDGYDYNNNYNTLSIKQNKNYFN